MYLLPLYYRVFTCAEDSDYFRVMYCCSVTSVASFLYSKLATRADNTDNRRDIAHPAHDAGKVLPVAHR